MAALCVRGDMTKSWEKGGKTEFVRLCKNLVASGTTLVEDVKEKDIKRAMYEVCSQAIRGSLKADQVAAVLAEVMDLHPDIPSLIADIFGIMDVEIMCKEEKEEREKFQNLLQACYHLAPEALVKERLDLDTLENIGLIQSKLVFNNKYVKLKTKLFYKQQKFNLLREESEGYSKLFTELNQDLIGNNVKYTSVLQDIKSLIGCFNLDPNRVLDIILESFECRPEMQEFFVPLLQSYIADQTTVCHILGFKFHFYQQTQDSETPASLYKVAALLLKHRLIELETLYPHLNPGDGDILERHKRDILEAKQYARKLNVVVLSDKASGAKQEKDDKETKPDQYHNNQKLGLVQAAIEIGDWEHAKKLLDKLPPFFAISYRPVADALCAMVSYMLEPVYVKYSGLPDLIQKKRKKVAPPEDQTFGGTKQAGHFADLVASVFPRLQYLGPHLATNTVLFGKLVRLAKSFMDRKASHVEEDDVKPLFCGFLTVFDEVILPSLSLIPCNCCLAEEVWGFIKQLKYQYRYRLYGQWKNESHSLHPKLIRMRADIVDRAKYIMKRLAKENVKPLGRQIAKLSHSNPGVLFEYILSQIQKYDNFIGPVVDSLKFLTSLSYDALAYCIIEALANPERERLKHDDTNISLWLQSLAGFSGSVFKKYQIDLAGLLQYVANQLKAGKSYDLLILREVVQKMAGIEVSEEVTNDQLDCMSGGELLKQEGGYFSQVRNTKKSSSRLKDSLLEQRLAIPMVLLMAQQRNGIVFTKDAQEDKRHIKLIGKLYDQCQDTLVQFTSFLSLQMNTDEFEKTLAPLDELMSTYHVSPDIAFALWRTIFTSNINAKYEELKKADKKDSSVTNSQTAKTQRYLEATETVMSPMAEALVPLIPARVREDISLQFYVTFWSLTMYDLQVPCVSYEKQVQQLKTQQNAIEDNKDLAQSKKKKEMERCTVLIDKLMEEEKRQLEHVKLVMARLKKEKDNWFSTKRSQTTITSIIQLCLFPRCCFTTVDALYCAKFLYTMHNLKTPNFSSLLCFDRLFTEITWALSSCTESEAHRFGRFLSSVFDDLMRWHSDRMYYDKECGNYPGFVTVLRKPNPNQTAAADCLDYENYRQVVYKWHYSLTKVAVQLLESGSYTQTRNVLIFLTKVLIHFPRVNHLGRALERRVDKVCQEEKERRPDLYALATGYHGQLKNKRKTWIIDPEFRKKEETQNKTQPKTAASSTSPASPASKEEKKGDETAAAPMETQEAPKQNGEVKADAVKVKPEKSDAPSRKPEKRSSEGRERRQINIARAEKENKPSPKRDGEAKDKKDSTGKDEEIVKPRRGKSKERSSKDKDRDKRGEKEAKVKVSDRASDKEERVKDKEPKVKDKDRDGTKEKEGDRRSKEHGKEKDDKYERKTVVKEEVKDHSWCEEKETGSSKHKEGRERGGDRDKAHKEKGDKATRGSDKEKERESKGHGKDKEKEREKDRSGHDVDQEHGSVTSSEEYASHSSSHRHSAEPSPKTPYEGDVKRRKVEVGCASKDSYVDAHDKHYKSPAYDRPERTESRDRGERERTEKEEKKRERKRVSLERSSADREKELTETKRHRAEESVTPKSSGSTGKLNGEPRDKVKEKQRSRSLDQERDLTPSRSREKDVSNHVGKQKAARKESPGQERHISDKHGSGKKSKHH